MLAVAFVGYVVYRLRKRGKAAPGKAEGGEPERGEAERERPEPGEAEREPEGAAVTGPKSEEPAASDEGRSGAQAPQGERGRPAKTPDRS